MDQAKSFMDNDDSASKKCQTTLDVISDYSAYTLFFLGMFLSLIYFSQGGDIITCNPVIICPSASDIRLNKSNAIKECDQYRNATSTLKDLSSTGYTMVLNFKSINQYKYTNIYCSQLLLGYACFAGPLLFGASIILFGIGRLWYGLPKVETNLKNLNVLINEAEKLPGVDLVKKVIDACKALDNNPTDEPSQSCTANCTLSARSCCRRRYRCGDRANSGERHVLLGGENEEERKKYFETRQRLADAAAKFQVNHIWLLHSFQDKMVNWKQSTKDYLHLLYVFLLFVRLVFTSLVIFGNVRLKMMMDCLGQNNAHHEKMVDCPEKNEFPCKATFHHNVTYSQICCSLNGLSFLSLVCDLAFAPLSINFLCCMLALCWIICKYREIDRKEWISSYWLLLKMQSKFQSQQIDVLSKVLKSEEKRQIETDIKSPFAKLDLTKGSSSCLPTYTVKEDVSGIPSCIYTKKIDEQYWCLEIKNNVAFVSTDFGGFRYLTGLKELKIIECHSISSEATLDVVEKLRIESSVLQEELEITDGTSNNNNTNDNNSSAGQNKTKRWKIQNLKSLTLVDIRPIQYLSLNVTKITELSLSEIVVHKTLESYGTNFKNIEKLSFCKCKMQETKLNITGDNFSKLTKLSLVDCGIQKIEKLACVNLLVLELKSNKIRLSREQQEQRVPPPGQISKLQRVIVTENCIDWIDYNFLNRFLVEGHLQSFEIAGNPLHNEAISSNISLLYYYANLKFGKNLLDSKKHGEYDIEEEECALPSFQKTDQSEKQAVFYCDIEHDQTRRRMMLYMSCIAQFLYGSGFRVLKGADFSKETPPKKDKCNTLYVFLAVQHGSVHDNITSIKEVLNKFEVNTYVVIDFEFGTSSDIRDKVKDLFQTKEERKRTLVLQRHPLMRQHSLMKEVATRLKMIQIHNIGYPVTQEMIQKVLFADL